MSHLLLRKRSLKTINSNKIPLASRPWLSKIGRLKFKKDYSLSTVLDPFRLGECNRAPSGLLMDPREMPR